MADLPKSVIVEIKPKMVVDLDTAKVCMRLVDWFLEGHDQYRLHGDGCEHEIMHVDDEGKWWR